MNPTRTSSAHEAGQSLANVRRRRTREKAGELEEELEPAKIALDFNVLFP